MLYDLKRDDLSGFNPRRFPQTRGLQDQKIQSMSPLELWWFKRLQQGAEAGWSTEVRKDELLNEYRTRTGLRNDCVLDLFYGLDKLLPADYPKNGPRPTVDGERKRTWTLPSLDHCREHFEQLFGLEDCWPDE